MSSTSALNNAPILRTLGIGIASFSNTKRTPASMANRAGFDRDFLGKRVTPPKANAKHKVLKVPAFAGNLLPYTHFSILMSATRRFPIFTAENIDGAKKKKLKRKDSWGFDPRIPETAQIGHDEFYGPQPFDKGHMVRRENPGWGTAAEAQRGEDDSFIYTNAIAQMPQLNQQTWLSLENYVLENTVTEGFKVSVFTGPVFRDDDREFAQVKVPEEFWKVVVAIDAASGQLLTSAYMLSQADLLPAARAEFQFGPFKTYQVPIAKVEELANIKFSRAVARADVFTPTEVRSLLRSNAFIEINSANDIVLTRGRTR